MADMPRRQPPPASPNRRSQPSPLLLMGAGLELAISIGGLSALGWLLDKHFQTAPWLLLTGLAMGMIGGFYNLWRTAKRYF